MNDAISQEVQEAIEDLVDESRFTLEDVDAAYLNVVDMTDLRDNSAMKMVLDAMRLATRKKGSRMKLSFAVGYLVAVNEQES